MQENLRPILAVGRALGLGEEDLEPYGRFKAKVRLEACQRVLDRPDGRLILTTALTPTPAGEGKTTTAVGLCQALGALGERVCVCLREPSLGPVFGRKGGASGAGLARLEPREDINLHLTGDLHAVGTAHNLLAALVDNHLYRGNERGLHPKAVLWRRVLDINDRQLRRIATGLGPAANGVLRESGFDITAASEIMAILCLALDVPDLKRRLGAILLGYTAKGTPVFCRDLGVTEALAVLLKDALKPNLVQTLEGQPAFVHGGPFANIAHGTSSALATRTALKLADYVITEAGFGADLGAEKFCHIVCAQTGLRPALAVLVVSLRALHMHGGAPARRAAEKDPAALERGLPNLDHHAVILARFGLPVVVAVNRFAGDAEEELRAVQAHCARRNLPCAVSDVAERGGAGGRELARLVLETLQTRRAHLRPLYDRDLPLEEKLAVVTREVYGGDGVDLSPAAREAARRLSRDGFGNLPVCIAKTPTSLSADPCRKGVPKGWRLPVQDLRGALGAGFVVAYGGDILTLPGLPADAARDFRLHPDGSVSGPW